MPRPSQKLPRNRKTISRSDRSIQLNMNASDRIQNSITSHLESIGNSMLVELQGSKRDRFKQQLLTTCISNTTTISKLPSLLTRRSFREVLADLHTFDCQTQRQYRTVGTGENDINAITSATSIETTRRNQNTTMLNNEPSLLTTKRESRQTNFFNSSETSKNKIKTTPKIIKRTICTRSSKLDTLTINPEEINHVTTNRARKRRSSLINNTNAQTHIDHVKSPLDVHKTIGEDISGVKISRKKLQSSVPLVVECPKPSIEPPISDDF